MLQLIALLGSEPPSIHDVIEKFIMSQFRGSVPSGRLKTVARPRTEEDWPKVCLKPRATLLGTTVISVHLP